MPSSHNRRIRNYIYLSLAALALGWMVGSAISPVLNIVISGVIGILLPITSLLSGLPEKADRPGEEPSLIARLAGLNVLPVALLCIALAAGAAGGIYIRTHKLLGTPQSSDTSPGLYAAPANLCSELALEHGDELKNALMAHGDEKVRAAVKACNGDSTSLETIKKMICP